MIGYTRKYTSLCIGFCYFNFIKVLGVVVLMDTVDKLGLAYHNVVHCSTRTVNGTDLEVIRASAGLADAQEQEQNTLKTARLYIDFIADTMWRYGLDYKNTLDLLKKYDLTSCIINSSADIFWVGIERIDCTSYIPLDKKIDISSAIVNSIKDTYMLKEKAALDKWFNSKTFRDDTLWHGKDKNNKIEHAFKAETDLNIKIGTAVDNEACEHVIERMHRRGIDNYSSKFEGYERGIIGSVVFEIYRHMPNKDDIDETVNLIMSSKMFTRWLEGLESLVYTDKYVVAQKILSEEADGKLDKDNTILIGPDGEGYGAFGCNNTDIFFAEGTRFFSIMQYIMYKQALHSGDRDIASRILNASIPERAVELAYDLPKDTLFTEEELEKCTLDAIRCYMASDSMKKSLLRTDGKELVYCDKDVTLLSCGLAYNDPDVYNKNNWKSNNILGECLMQFREELKIK